MRAAFKTVFSTPPAAETCAPIFHGLVTRVGILSVRLSLSSVAVRRRFLGLVPLSATSEMKFTVQWETMIYLPCKSGAGSCPLRFGGFLDRV